MVSHLRRRGAGDRDRGAIWSVGTGVGLNFVRPNGGTTPNASSFGIGAGIWGLLTTVVALTAGGCAAARLAAVGCRFDGILHGLVIWSVALLLTIYLVTSAAGGLIGGVSSLIGWNLIGRWLSVQRCGRRRRQRTKVRLAASSAGHRSQSRHAAAGGKHPAVTHPASMSRPDAVKAIGATMPDLLANNGKTAAAKQRIIDIVAVQAHISPQDAQKHVDDARTRLAEARDQAVQTARQTADACATAASHASFLTFAGLVIGALAAAIGGAMASPYQAGQSRAETGGAELAAGRFR
jgi:hypothetical protein